MSQNTLNNTPELAAKIKKRRVELNLTIESAAQKAGVGTKTWYRYESGEAIRSDKIKGVCRALNWSALPTPLDDDCLFVLTDYTENSAWSDYISQVFGDAAAISFVIGSEILGDYINEALCQLASMPKGSHLGQLDFAMLTDMLPEQFLMCYDYDFVYRLKTVLFELRSQAANGPQLIAHRVIDELVLYLIVDAADFLMDCMRDDMLSCGIDIDDDWRDWIFDLFDDSDVETFLYSNWYITSDHIYHFDHWYENLFFV